MQGVNFKTSQSYRKMSWSKWQELQNGPQINPVYYNVVRGSKIFSCREPLKNNDQEGKQARSHVLLLKLKLLIDNLTCGTLNKSLFKFFSIFMLKFIASNLQI